MRLFVLLFSLLAFLPIASGEEQNAASPVEVVEKLYTAHLAENGPLQDETHKGWNRVFAKELLGVLKAEGGWQFDPLIFAQDSDVKKVTVTEIETTNAAALVLVKFVNFGKPVRLVVSLVKGEGGYLIQNIVEPATGIDLINNVAQ